MTCAEARDAMLTAEIDVLAADARARAETDATLSNHLAACGACAAMAAALTADLAAMRTAALGRLTNRRRGTRRAVAAALPVAATIVVAISALVYHRRASTGAGSASDVAAAGSIPGTAGVNDGPRDGVSVQIAPGQQATVFRTSDPKVTVVWLTPESGL